MNETTIKGWVDGAWMGWWHITGPHPMRHDIAHVGVGIDCIGDDGAYELTDWHDDVDMLAAISDGDDKQYKGDSPYSRLFHWAKGYIEANNETPPIEQLASYLHATGWVLMLPHRWQHRGTQYEWLPWWVGTMRIGPSWRPSRAMTMAYRQQQSLVASQGIIAVLMAYLVDVASDRISDNPRR